MMRFKRFFVFLPLVLLSFPLRHLHAVVADDPPTAGKEVVLKAADISPKIFPERVFFRGQSAPVQFRNSGGVHFADDLYVLAGMVDSSGYSTGLKEKYQAYLLNEVTLEHRGKLPALRRPRLRGIPQGPLASAIVHRKRARKEIVAADQSLNPSPPSSGPANLIQSLSSLSLLPVFPRRDGGRPWPARAGPQISFSFRSEFCACGI